MLPSAFFLIVLLTTRIVFHVMLKERHRSILLVVFPQSSLSNIQGNHGSSGANGGSTVISAKTSICRKPRKVIPSSSLPRHLVPLTCLGPDSHMSKQLRAIFPSKKLWMNPDSCPGTSKILSSYYKVWRN